MKKKKSSFFSLNLDFVGFTASMLCAVHCAAVPLLLTFGALSGLAWLETPWIEMSFIGVSLVVASWSLLRSYLIHHQKFTAISVVLLGFLLIVTSRFAAEGWEPALTVLGGVAIAVAHIINWRMCKQCQTCTLHYPEQRQERA